ncbi:hypothetical protein [Rhizobium tubonense]|uniref:Bacteriophage P22, Gp10, DNA-stabilising n=1 Tax=Rhizobium tubonense TaxID=484088 RepID=A0A2W4E4V5_9HYPH|nr:hypothetical protein [Rhizobium tubonense]PZM07583.1 hypothetical protein CPY51_31125 [Rhizobium tubonense]
MTDIVWPNSTSPGARPGEGSGRLINCYAEALESGARASFVRRRVPGLARLIATAFPGCRGFHFYNGDLYVAQSNRLSRINVAAGVYSQVNLGALAGIGRVTFARNNKVPTPDIVCVTENGAFIVNRTTAPTSFTDPDLPQPVTVAFLDGYFVFAIRDGRFFTSGINDITINALDFGKAESHSGGLLNAVAFGEQLMLMGPSSVEFWQNAGNATGTPFSRSSVVARGLASTFAVAGTEYGFSSLIFIGDDNGVYRIDGGYQPTKISNADLDRLITAVADKTLLDVTVAVTEAHAWATVSGPNFSWTYELATGFWHERASYLDDHWRGVCSVQAFGGWVIGDRTTGDIWLLNPDIQTEGTNPLVMKAYSLPSIGFPNRVAIPRADFDIIVGQGKVTGLDPIEVDPVCLISWSDDGGATFGTPLKRSLGRLAKYMTNVVINRAGSAGRYGRVWCFEVSDRIYVGLLGGSMDGILRSK